MTSEAQDSIQARLEEIYKRLELVLEAHRLGNLSIHNPRHLADWDDVQFLLEQSGAERAARETAERNANALAYDKSELHDDLEALSARLAAAEARVSQLESAIRWALGEEGEFVGDWQSRGRYWWRTELRARAALASSTPERP